MRLVAPCLFLRLDNVLLFVHPHRLRQLLRDAAVDKPIVEQMVEDAHVPDVAPLLSGEGVGDWLLALDPLLVALQKAAVPSMGDWLWLGGVGGDNVAGLLDIPAAPVPSACRRRPCP